MRPRDAQENSNSCARDVASQMHVRKSTPSQAATNLVGGQHRLFDGQALRLRRRSLEHVRDVYSVIRGVHFNLQRRPLLFHLDGRLAALVLHGHVASTLVISVSAEASRMSNAECLDA